MPLFMGVRTPAGGIGFGDVADAHLPDLAEHEMHGVPYLRYCGDEGQDKIVCGVDTSNAESADAVHRQAHDHRQHPSAVATAIAALLARNPIGPMHHGSGR